MKRNFILISIAILALLSIQIFNKKGSSTGRKERIQWNMGNVIPQDINTGKTIPRELVKGGTFKDMKEEVGTSSEPGGGEYNSPPANGSMIFYAKERLEGTIGILDSSMVDRPADNVFHIAIDQYLEKEEIAYLEYDLYGVQDYTSVCKGINDNISTGALFVKICNMWSRQSEKIPVSGLKKGDNVIRFSVASGCDYGYKIKNVNIRVENRIAEQDRGTEAGASAQPRQLIINQPKERYYFKNVGYISGFVSGKGSEKVKVYGNGKLIRCNGSLFEGIIEKPKDTNESWQGEITAVFEDGQQINKKVGFDKQSSWDYEDTYRNDVPYYEKEIYSDRNFEMNVTGFGLEGEAGSVAINQKLSVTGLRTEDMAVISASIINVTRENKGYRCLPHGSLFDKNMKVRIKYDSASIPEGYSAEDIRTYYYDDQQGDWIMLEYDTVDLATMEVISNTNHFTDFINGILKVPESPTTQAFTPTSLKDLKFGDPMAGYNLISPPSANNNGTANLSYPIELPKGRQGMQPQLAISYNSEGGNGWLGVGWNLEIPSITVDTRWGVPHYFPDKESESYLLNGEELLPQIQRNAFKARNLSEDEIVFKPKVEGAFNKIVRHGTSPKNYWWEVTDKQGVKYFYGKYSADADVNSNCVLTDDVTNNNGNIAHWALAEVRDLNDNYVKYNYTRTTHDLGNGSVGHEQNIDNIVYTGWGSTDGKYSVSFELDDHTKPDYSISARNGFLETNEYLLKTIRITYDSQFIRSYVIKYRAGAYGKQLVCFIADVTKENVIPEIMREDFGCDDVNKDGIGCKFSKFEYYDGVDQSFTDPVTVAQEDDDNTNNLIEDIFESNHEASLGKNTTYSWNVGGSLNIGIGPNPCTKTVTVGGSINAGESDSKTNLLVMDIDGDGLPDRLYKTDDGYKFRKLEFNSNNELEYSSTENSLLNLPGLGKSNSSSLTWGLEGQVVVACGSFSHTRTDTYNQHYFADVNGDGYVDFINGGKVFYNTNGTDGNRVFVPESNDTIQTIDGNPCDYIIRSGGVNDSVFTPYVDMDTISGKPNPQVINGDEHYGYLRDAVRMWVAPYDGVITIENPVQLIEDHSYNRQISHKADGVYYTVELNNTKLFEEKIGRSDYSLHYWSQSNVQISKGEKIYFRLMPRCDRSYDRVAWGPEIKYTNCDLSTADSTMIDADGKKVYVFKPSDDMLINSQQKTIFPFTGTVRIKGQITVDNVSDTVDFSIHDFSGYDVQNTFADNSTSSYSIDDVIDVTADSSMFFTAYTNTNIDWNKISYDFKIIYLTTDTILDTTKTSKRVVIRPMVNYSIYQNDIQASIPYSFNAGIYLIDPSLVSGLPTNYTGELYFAVKNNQNTIRKWSIPFSNGQPVSSAKSIYLPAGNIYFEYYGDTIAAVNISDAQVIVDNNESSPYNAGFHCLMVDTLWQYGNLYRGWGQFSYADNSDTTITYPIDESKLSYGNIAKHTNMITFDANNMTDEFSSENELSINGNNNPSEIPFAIMIPDLDSMFYRDFAGYASVSRNKICNTISVTPPYGTTDDTIYDSPLNISIVPSVPVRTIGRSSVDINKAWSVGASFGISLSYSQNKTKSRSITDYMDLNGDRYPDFVGTENVQFSTPQGGFFNNITPSIMDDISRSTFKGEGYAAGVNLPSSGKFFPDIKSYFSKSKTNSDNSNSTISSGNIGASAYPGKTVSNFELSDVNGDGLPDKVYIDGSLEGSVALNLGYSFAPSIGFGNINDNENKAKSYSINAGIDLYEYSWSFGMGLSYSENHAEHNTIDINGDGLPDYIELDNNNLVVYVNTGHSFGSSTNFQNNDCIHKGYGLSGSANLALTAGFSFWIIKIPINVQVSGSAGANYEKSMMIDMNNDGYPDIVQANNTLAEPIQVRYNKLGKVNLLKSVTNQTNSRYFMDYDLTTCNQTMPQRHWVLASLKVFDGFTGDGQDTTYQKFSYADGHYDRFNRSFYGFKRVTTEQYDNFVANNIYRTTIENYHNDNYMFKGLKYYDVIMAGTADKYIETYYKWDRKEISTGKIIPEDSAQCYGPYYPAISQEDKFYYEGGANYQIHTQIKYRHGKYGNIERYINRGDVADGTDDVFARIHYTYDTTKNLLAMADTLIVKDTNDNLMRERTGEYYGNGQIKTIGGYDGSDFALTSLKYDGYGNLAEIVLPKNSNGQEMTYDYGYDPVVYTYPIEIKDAFGLHSTSTYDYRLGVPLTVTDAGGNVMEYSYYADGKPFTVRGPKEIASGADYTIKFEYSDELPLTYNYTWAKTSHLDPQDGSFHSNFVTVNTADGLGRNIESQKNVFVNNANRWLVSGRQKFDAYGRCTSVSLPVLANSMQYYQYNSSPNLDSTIYDVMDRPEMKIAPDLTMTHYKYRFGSDASGRLRFLTDFIDPKGLISSTFTNGQGLKTMFVAPMNTKTLFYYNPVGELLATVDPENNKTSYKYDKLGKLLFREHLDAGTTEYTYDLSGNLLSQVTANLHQNAEKIDYKYDYNRLTFVNYPDNHENDVFYEYGGHGDGNKAGRIVKIQDNSGIQDFDYDNMGNVIHNKHTYFVPNGNHYTFEMSWVYDSWNRIDTIIYPDAEIVSYHYNSAGQLNEMQGKKGIWNYHYIDNVTYNMYGSRKRIDYGNGTWAVYSYNQLNQELTNLKSYNGNGHLMQNLDYVYDDAKNITEITNSANSVNGGLGGIYHYSYKYDDLYRLVGSGGNFGLAYNYNLHMSYSPSGNILEKDLTANTYIGGVQNNISYGNAYQYNGKPHAVSSAGTCTYNWDANGNMINKIESNQTGHSRNLWWDEENRLASTADYGGNAPNYVSVYIYNAGGERVWKLAGVNQTMLVNGQPTINSVNFNKTLYCDAYMVMDDHQYTKHYFIEGERVCTKIGGGFPNNHILRDSVAVISGNFDQICKMEWEMVNRVAAKVCKKAPQLTIRPQLLSAQVRFPMRENSMFFYHSDHLGSSSFITDAAGDAIQHLQYLPFGESFVDERHSSPYYTPYKFSGKEKDDETGFSYFGARYYDGDLSVWLSVDPMSDKYPSLSCYMYCGGNPVVLVDPDGMSVGTPSTHTDEDGNVIAVYNDGDNSVYKHDNINNKTELDKVYNSENTSAGGTKMGETEYWDEFVSPETGNTLTNNKIQFGKSFDPILAKLHLKAEDMNLKNIASESGSGGLFDVKKTYKNVGALLNGKYATSRSAGNFLAGYNAEGATLLGISISFETFQKLAGALHVCESQGIKFTVCRKTDILLNGTTYGNPPAYGEEIYQYRMSKNGWNKAQFYGNK